MSVPILSLVALWYSNLIQKAIGTIGIFMNKSAGYKLKFFAEKYIFLNFSHFFKKKRYNKCFLNSLLPHNSGVFRYYVYCRPKWSWLKVCSKPFQKFIKATRTSWLQLSSRRGRHHAPFLAPAGVDINPNWLNGSLGQWGSSFAHGTPKEMLKCRNGNRNRNRSKGKRIALLRGQL